MALLKYSAVVAFCSHIRFAQQYANPPSRVQNPAQSVESRSEAKARASLGYGRDGPSRSSKFGTIGSSQNPSAALGAVPFRPPRSGVPNFPLAVRAGHFAEPRRLAHFGQLAVEPRFTGATNRAGHAVGEALYLRTRATHGVARCYVRGKQALRPRDCIS